MKRYNFHELRALAKSQGTPKQGYMNKDQLCKALGIVRIEHTPKYSLESVETGKVTEWRSTTVISRTFNTDPGNVLYALRKNRPLKIQEGLFYVRQLRP